jgi:hypothetical protein
MVTKEIPGDSSGDPYRGYAYLFYHPWFYAGADA